MEYFTVYKHTDYLYQIKDSLGVLSTLLIGKTKALVIDTCYGIGDLYKEIRKITNLPLLVINSHGHMDHTCGNYQFEKVYIHSLDYDLLKKHNSKEWKQKNIDSAINSKVLPNDFDINKYLTSSFGNIEFLDDIKTFDIGVYTLEVINTPGHTKGSISLYCKELKIMFVSDAICQYVWLFLDESTDINTYINSINKVLEYDFDYFLVGHGPRLINRKDMIDYLNVAKTIDVTKSNKVVFKNFEECNSYEYSTNGLYNPNGCGVVFNIDRIKK